MFVNGSTYQWEMRANLKQNINVVEIHCYQNFQFKINFNHFLLWYIRIEWENIWRFNFTFRKCFTFCFLFTFSDIHPTILFLFRVLYNVRIVSHVRQMWKTNVHFFQKRPIRGIHNKSSNFLSSVTVCDKTRGFFME